MSVNAISYRKHLHTHSEKTRIYDTRKQFRRTMRRTDWLDSENGEIKTAYTYNSPL